jgi:hypothetical protein
MASAAVKTHPPANVPAGACAALTADASDHVSFNITTGAKAGQAAGAKEDFPFAPKSVVDWARTD